MKIVHLVTALNFGGLERRMEILSRYPSKQNEQVFCALGGGGATFEKMIFHGSDTYLLECDPKIFRIKTFLRLRDFLKNQQPDILHTHGCEANFYGHLASLMLGIKVRVAEEIGIPSLTPFARAMFSLIFNLPQAVIAMSPAVKDFLLEKNIVKSEKIKFVYNPVLLSTNNEYTKDNDKVRFVFVGRLEEVKNPVGLLRAFHGLLSDHLDVQLIYVGEGSQRKEIEDYINLNNINKYVSCVGFCSSPERIIHSCHVVVQPSHSEGFSLALVEAMSCGLPAVVTPVGSAKLLIKNNINGWVVSSSEDEAILEGLKYALDSRQKLEEMGSAAREVAYHYDPKLYSIKLDDFYAGLGSY